MDRARARVERRRVGWLLAAAALAACGCQTVRTPEDVIAKSGVPRELQKTSMPEYVVEPPDLLDIEVLQALPGRPIGGEYLVRPDGTVHLGFYGDVYVAGLTLTEIKEKIVIHLRKYVKDEILGLVEIENAKDSEGKEVLDEEGRPKPIYKKVDPKDSDRVSVDVAAYNSKVYYVEGDVGLTGRFPVTGNETVLDAINYAGGLSPTAAQQNIRLVRPAPPGSSQPQVLPVNYAAIVQAGDPTTNYQLMPGDRLFVYRDPIVRTTIFLDRLAAPFNSVLNSIMTYSFAARNLNSIGIPINGVQQQNRNVRPRPVTIPPSL